ncbi:MFS transporter [Actinokineospora soli]|uniref:MFS transporter n=1 Tax=Actinokineospora soli TaxID=1048753 RepID=A0ABW2TS71_9PSEU
MAGAPLGAWLIASGALWPALAVVAATCAISLTALVFVTRDLPRPATPPSLRQVTISKALLNRSADGLRLLRANPRLRWLFVSSFTIDLAFNWPIAAALPLLADERSWGVQAVATVIAAFSAGALTATAIGAAVAHRIPLVLRLVASAALIAVGILLMAVMPSVLSLAAVGYVVGLASGLNGPAIVTLYQDAAPADRMGAAMATLAIAGIGTAPFSIALFGALAALLGIQATWIVCGLVAMVAPVAAVAALRTPVAVPEREAVSV